MRPNNARASYSVCGLNLFSHRDQCSSLRRAPFDNHKNWQPPFGAAGKSYSISAKPSLTDETLMQ